MVEPAWLTLLPPLAAIVLALAFRELVITRFIGIWLGALFLASWDPVTATLLSVRDFTIGALVDPDHVAIILFTFLVGGMVSVMSRSGGALGIVEALRPLAVSRRRGQLITWVSGLIVFFDDYANALIVGNTFRPVTDRLKVSREKLAYIVDSTAAPVAAVAVISTWVGFEISLIRDALNVTASYTADPAARARLLEAAAHPFGIFLHSIPYLFYPIFALLFGLLVVALRRDFGPMAEAEERAAAGRGLIREGASPGLDPAILAEPPRGTPHRWYNAGLPVLTLIGVALAEIVITGVGAVGASDASLGDIVGASDPLQSLIWATIAGSLVAVALALGQRLLTVRQAVGAWIGGLRSMMAAITILVLAWALGGVTAALGTGAYLSTLLDGAVPMGMLPALVFLVSAVITLATGTSWGTMAILYPIVVPLTIGLGAGVQAGSEGHTILLGVISAIMAGAIFGDHCSPISDTTIVSSISSACDHIDHVRTQIPYAAVVALVAVAVGSIPTAYGLTPWIALPLGVAVLAGTLLVFGRQPRERTDADVADAAAEIPVAAVRF